MEEETIRKKIATMLPVLDEKQTCLYLAYILQVKHKALAGAVRAG
jgi:hypothetical protein